MDVLARSYLLGTGIFLFIALMAHFKISSAVGSYVYMSDFMLNVTGDRSKKRFALP